jgi:hypothetical protein
VAAVHPDGSVVVVVLPRQEVGVHAQPDVQHAVWPLPSEKQVPPPGQSASDEHGDESGLLLLGDRSTSLTRSLRVGNARFKKSAGSR